MVPLIARGSVHSVCSDTDIHCLYIDTYTVNYTVLSQHCQTGAASRPLTALTTAQCQHVSTDACQVLIFLILV